MAAVRFVTNGVPGKRRGLRSVAYPRGRGRGGQWCIQGWGCSGVHKSRTEGIIVPKLSKNAVNNADINYEQTVLAWRTACFLYAL